MPQPTLPQLFPSPTLNGNTLSLDLSGLNIPGNATPLETWVAIHKFGFDWILANTDQAVMASAQLSEFGNITRGTATGKRQFNLSLSLYLPENPTIFNPFAID